MGMMVYNSPPPKKNTGRVNLWRAMFLFWMLYFIVGLATLDAFPIIFGLLWIVISYIFIRSNGGKLLGVKGNWFKKEKNADS